MKMFKKIKEQNKRTIILFGFLKFSYTKVPNAERARKTKKAWTEYSRRHLDLFVNSEIVANLRSDSLCIDCGANIGEVTNVFASRGAEVYAFEPHPLCCQRLRVRFAGNDKVHICNEAVLDKAGKMKLYHSDLSEFDKEFFSQSSSLYESKTNIVSRFFDEINVIDLVGFIRNLNRPIDILKLDVEGAEFCILKRIIDEGLYHDIKNILVETHDDSIPEIKETAAAVRRLIIEKGITNINLDWV